MDLSDIIQYFCSLSGVQPEDAAPWQDLAEGCITRLRIRLRPDIVEADHMQILDLAAAGMLLYQYTAAQPATGENIKIGDISVSGGSTGLKEARALRDELLAGAAHLLNSEQAFLIQVGE